MKLQLPEYRKEVLHRMKARAKDGSERWIEEVASFSRTKRDDGTWTDWKEEPHQFWSNGAFCNRVSATEFVPLMSDERLVLVDDAKEVVKG